MTDTAPTTPATPAPATPPATPAAPQGQQAAQEPHGALETDWKAEARKWEDRAKANKAAADQLQKLEDEKKTTEQRQAEALATTQRERDEANAKLLRHEVAKDKNLDPGAVDLLTGTSREEIEKAADALIAWREAQSTPRSPAPQPMQGAAGANPATSSEGDQFAAFLQQQLS